MECNGSITIPKESLSTTNYIGLSAFDTCVVTMTKGFMPLEGQSTMELIIRLVWMQLFAHSADGVLGWLEKIVAENCNKNLDKKN